jgi:hypothetical protein
MTWLHQKHLDLPRVTYEAWSPCNWGHRVRWLHFPAANRAPASGTLPGSHGDGGGAVVVAVVVLHFTRNRKQSMHAAHGSA